MPFTRLGLEGYGVRRVGSFAGKTATEVVVVAETGGVRQSRRWNTDSLDLSKWGKKKRKLEAKIESVQKRIDATRAKADRTFDYAKVEALKKRIAELQQLLLSLLGLMDELRKAQDEEDASVAVAVYIAYRKLH